jgi:hypothetical protein
MEMKKKTLAKPSLLIILIALLLFAGALSFLFAWKQYLLPNRTYREALSLAEQGEFLAAREAFLSLGDFRDSAQQAENLTENCRWERLNRAQVGDTVFFGAYEQDNQEENGKEAIPWIVLDVQDGRALLLSKYALDTGIYGIANASWQGWEYSSLRSWLNHHFFDTAFSEEDQKRIPTTLVYPDSPPHYHQYSGYATEDRVFLLNITETERYFSSPWEKRCYPTAYAKAQGVNKGVIALDGKEPTCDWWLRSRTDTQSQPMAAYISGGFLGSADLNQKGIGVRPAIWLDQSVF